MSKYETTITQQQMYRRYPTETTKYNNVQNLLALSVKKIMPDIHTILNNPITFYVSYIDIQDPKQRLGAEIVGYVFSHARPSVKVGEHFIAMKHPKVPIKKMDFGNILKERTTFSFDEDEYKFGPEGFSDSNDNAKGLFQKELVAHLKGISNKAGFISYALFHNLSRINLSSNEALESNPESKSPRKAKGPKGTGSEYRNVMKPWAEVEYEAHLELEFNPANAQEKGYPTQERVLALEQLPNRNINPNYEPPKTNPLLEAILSIRKKLRETKRVEYEKRSSRFYREVEVDESVSDSLSLREKIMWTAIDMVYNSQEYMVDIDMYGDVKPTVTASDLICIVNYEDIANLELGIPGYIEPKNWQFTPADLKVGKVIESKWMPKGEALILHKDLIKLLIVENKAGEFNYSENGVVNRWLDWKFVLSTIDWYGCCYITKKTTPKPEPSSS